MDFIKIQNTAIKQPNSYSPTYAYIKEASRNTSGTLKQKIIAVKRKLICNWKHLTATELQQILNLCDNNGADEVTIIYFDSKYNGLRTGKFYTNDREPAIWRALSDATSSEYLDFSLNFIEF